MAPSEITASLVGQFLYSGVLQGKKTIKLEHKRKKYCRSLLQVNLAGLELQRISSNGQQLKLLFQFFYPWLGCLHFIPHMHSSGSAYDTGKLLLQNWEL